MVLEYTHRIFISLALLLTLDGCIDPYIPKLAGYETLLVVDGLITNANSSYSVKLTRTFQEADAIPVIVSDASVSIKDDIGTEINLKYKGEGIYKSDSLEFRGVPGRTYLLHIVTGDNEEYESDPCLMQPVPDIDSIYIAKDQVLVNNQTESEDGVSIYLDSKGGNDNLYYRWTYEETWKFKVPDPKLYDYTKVLDKPNAPLITPVADIKEFCWKYHRSDDILIRSIDEGQSTKITKQPLNFIATEKSDRLLIQYSILVNQYSISKDEYKFWNNLQQVNVGGGDIFARQPYAVISNIHSIKNLNERVLGFFQVSAVSQKRMFIPYRDVALMGLHFYSYPCRVWQFKPGDFGTPYTYPPITWDDVYWYLCIVSDYYFIQPIYQGLSDSILLELQFTRPECADCELTGSHIKPDFWTDL